MIDETRELSEVLMKFGPLAAGALLFVASGYQITGLKDTLDKNLTFKKCIISGYTIASVCFMCWGYSIMNSNVQFSYGNIEYLEKDEKIYSDKMYLKEKEVGEIKKKYEWVIYEKDVSGQKDLDLSLVFDVEGFGKQEKIFKLPTEKLDFLSRNEVKITLNRESLDLYLIPSNDNTESVSDKDNEKYKLEAITVSNEIENRSTIEKLFNFIIPKAYSRGGMTSGMMEVHNGLLSDNPRFKRKSLKRIMGNKKLGLDYVKYVFGKRPNPKLNRPILDFLNTLPKTTIRSAGFSKTQFESIALLAASPNKLVRKQAGYFLRKNYEREGIDFGKSFLARSDEQSKLLGIQILKSINSTSAINSLKIADRMTSSPRLKTAMGLAFANNSKSEVIRKLPNMADPKRVHLVSKIKDYQDQGVKFSWSGKDIKKGISSFEFAKKVLKEAGILSGVRILNVGSLKKYYKASSLKGANLSSYKAGDLIIYEYGIVMFYLGQDQVIGLTPAGVQVNKLNFGPKPLEVAKILK